MTPLSAILTALAALWLAAIALGLWANRANIRPNDLEYNLAYRLTQAYCLLFHRLTLINTPAAREAERLAATTGRPIIVVANHTAGIDPALVIVGLNTEPRWMMATDMREPALEWFWRFTNLIFVDRTRQDAASLRIALRHLKAGGTLGIFPEGHIERPPGAVQPFRAGVGLMIKKSRAITLPVAITGTPQVEPAWASLWTPSKSTVTYLPPIDYTQTDLDPQAIADDLRQRIAHAANLPLTDHQPTLGDDGLWTWTDLDGSTVRTWIAP